MLARLLGKPDLLPEITRQYRRGDVRHCVADTSLARQLLGFEPAVSWEDGLTELIAWARSSPAHDRFDQAQRELAQHGLVSDPLR